MQPAGQRLGGEWNRGVRRRPGEDESAGPEIAIQFRLDRGQQLRFMLILIDAFR
jgi:hypothetical protein